MEAFFQEIAKYVQLSNEAKAALADCMVPAQFARGALVLKPGSVCNYVYFVETGLLRTFYAKHEKDVTDWFSPEHTFSVSILSFISRTRDRRGIEALEDTAAWGLHYDALNQLYDQHHEIERLGRMLYGLGVMQVQQRFDELHFSTAMERYARLMETNPTILQRAPLSMVASYLGITQETLSRMRAQYTPGLSNV